MDGNEGIGFQTWVVVAGARVGVVDVVGGRDALCLVVAAGFVV